MASHENKEIDEIETMIEAAAIDTERGTWGLDKIVERDDEGGGEQVEGDGTDDDKLPS